MKLKSASSLPLVFGFFCSVFAFLFASLVAVGCRTAGSNDERARSEADLSIFGLNSAPLRTIEMDSKDERRLLAERMTSDFSRLLSDTSTESRAMRIQVTALLDALKNGAHSLCSPSERVRLFRGQGIGVNFTSKTGSSFVASDGALGRIGYPFDYPKPNSGVPVRFSGASWEDLIREKRSTSAGFSVSELIQNFASAETFNSKTRKPFGISISTTHFESLAARHVSGAGDSPFLSYSALPDVAAIYGPPFHIIEVCPARVGVHSKSVPYEREGLILAFTLPEENVAIVDEELSAYQRALVGQQVDQGTLGAEQASWLATRMQESRDRFEAAQTPYLPRSLASQCLSGVPARLRSLKGKQSEVANDLYEKSRGIIAATWPELPPAQSCGCLASVLNANELLVENEKFEVSELCPN